MKKIVIRDKNLIQIILEKRFDCKEITLYIMGEDAKLAIMETGTLKRRVFIPIEKEKNAIKNI